MPIVSVRVPVEVRDALSGLADGQGLSLSVYLRDLLFDLVCPHTVVSNKICVRCGVICGEV